MTVEPQGTRPGPEEPGPGTPIPPGPGPGPGPAPGPVDRTGRRAMWLGLGALLMLFVPLLGFFAVAPAVAAVVIGVKARRKAKRSPGSAPGALAGIVLGSVGIVLFIAAIAVQVVLLDETNRYAKCKSAANTISEEKQCKDDLAREIEKKFGLPKGSLKGSSLPF